ncbi:hypothetical protein [Nitrospira sp. Ecomares 2.1]
MTKSIHMLCMQHAINAATKILDELSNSTHFFLKSRKNDSSFRMTPIDHAIQGTDVSVEVKSEETIHTTNHPVSVTPPTDNTQ